ncbi:MAG: hypothetical protein ACE5IB_05060 [Candidatus Geothermarchaeales archaeon]
MGTTEQGADPLERSIIRLGGAFALLVAVLPWIATLFGLPLILSGFSLLMDVKEFLLLINSNKLSFIAFLIHFIVAGFAILPVILAIFLRFRRTSVLLGALLWGAGTFMIELGMLLYLSLLPLSDRLVAAGSVMGEACGHRRCASSALVRSGCPCSLRGELRHCRPDLRIGDVERRFS